MFAFLNKPYPHTENFRRTFLVSLCIGVFVALFLIVFQPFDISRWEDPQKKLKLAGYGIVSFLIPVLTGIVLQFIPAKEREDNWKVWKEITNTLLAVLLIAFGNLFYSTLIGIGTVSFKNYFNFIFITFAVGIFPIALSVASKYNRFLKLNQRTAAEVNTVLDEKPKPTPTPAKQKLILIAENDKDKLELEADDLLYIESADNYSTIHYLTQDSTHKIMMRGSLKRIESQCTSFPQILRCHRAFIVNTKNVTHIEGNAAGYKLSIKKSEVRVPVSRNYGTSLTEELKTRR